MYIDIKLLVLRQNQSLQSLDHCPHIKFTKQFQQYYTVCDIFLSGRAGKSHFRFQSWMWISMTLSELVFNKDGTPKAEKCNQVWMELSS